ncbi:MAG: ATPase [Clostridiales bacterium]|nr:ATPase [Clostridiales bacterium]
MKKYILIAGANGAGKSTLYQSLPSLRYMPRINADEILKGFGDWRNIVDVMTAGKMAVKRISQYLDEEITFNQETTLCGKTILKNIEKAKKKGFFIELHYVGVDSVDIAKERVAERVRQGGHGISERDVERRYVETFHGLKNVLPNCDLAVFYDNTIHFRRFAIYENGILKRVSLNVPIWYKRFISDI